ncbi:MAG: hypothetical protein ACTHMM_11305 [Agriterribacter sp.]
MKKTLIACSILVCACLTMAFVKNDAKTHVVQSAPLTTVSVTLSGNYSGTSYRIIFSKSGYDQQFPMPSNGSSTISIPNGKYTVGIAPAGGSYSSYSFSGSSCAVYYSGSGSDVLWSNVDLTCGTASFSMN